MANPIYWCLQKAPVPSNARACLSPAEKTIFEGFQFEARKKSWLAGRFTAKHLISQVYEDKHPADQIEIRNNELGAPIAYHNKQSFPGCLTISHSGDWAVSAYTPSGLQIGIDLEMISTRSNAFIQDYFTHNEAEMVIAKQANKEKADKPSEAKQMAERATLIWSAKEALLKALGIGLRVDTRQVEVIDFEEHQPTQVDSWSRFKITSTKVGAPVRGYWRQIDRFLITLAVINRGSERLSLVEVK